jgi:hypothetical protein
LESDLERGFATEPLARLLASQLFEVACAEKRHEDDIVLAALEETYWRWDVLDLGQGLKNLEFPREKLLLVGLFLVLGLDLAGLECERAQVVHLVHFAETALTDLLDQMQVVREVDGGVDDFLRWVGAG